MPKACTINGCPRPLLARGWCATHYQRWRTTGDPGGAELLRTPGDPAATEKRCTSCGELRPLAEYHREKRNRDGRASHCKVCYERGQRRARLIRKYGITAERYDEMALDQGGRCAMCDEVPEKLVIDHCHRSGLVRALLCDRCNRLLGVADDNPDLFRAALEFLAAH